MSHDLRIGLCPLPSEPFWLQVEEAIHRRAQRLAIELVPLSRDDSLGPISCEGLVRAEELLALELDALIGWLWSKDLAYQVLESGLPIIHLCETSVSHPLSVSPRGLRDAAGTLAAFVAEQLAGQGNVLVAGGLVQAGPNDDGKSRIAGIQEIFAGYPKIIFKHIPCAWSGEKADQQIRAAIQQFSEPFDAILGLSDSLALVARDIGRSLNLIDKNALIGGINGDPLALAAIARGDMTATVALFPEEFGARAVELAHQAARKGLLAAHLYKYQLVTARNITDVMADRLTALSSLPGWLAEANRQRQQQRLNQLEASLEIIGRIQSRLDSYRQLREIVELVCDEHGYDRAKIYRWVEQEQRLFLIYPSNPSSLDVWYDLDGGSWKQVFAQMPGHATLDDGNSEPTNVLDPGNVIIADGLGRMGDWYDLTGASSNSVVDQIASWATAESKAFAQEFEARYSLKPSPSAAGLSYDYANMWIHIARQVFTDAGELSRNTLADFTWNRLLAGEWSYTHGCIMREYKYTPETAPDPVVGPHYFIFSVLEYLDGEGVVIFPSESAEHDLPPKREGLAPVERPPAQEATKVFKLGVMGPFSGLNAPVGAEMKGAVEMAFEKVGYRVGPYKIELVWIDCQSDPVKGAQAYEEAIVQQGIQAGLLNWHTSVALACMEVAARHKVPHFFGLAGANAINETWRSDPRKYFYWVKGWPEPAKLTADYVMALENAITRGLWQPVAKTAAFWGEDTEWGRSFAAGMKGQLEAAGWKIVAEDYFPLDQTDFVPWLTKIKEKNPALLAGTASNPTTYSSFVKQAHKLGLERMFTWSPASQPSIPVEESDILGRALLRNEPVYIPYRSQSLRPSFDSALADTRARLVLPIRHGEKVLGLLDLRSRRATWHTRLELVSLQLLADQLGHAMWDAQLYGRAVQAQAIAERSDRSKTRLLANVSHELRTPLNVILGYTQRALDSFRPYHADLPAALVNDLQHIHRTSEHLLHMTNDLLDLSRAEIQELELLLKIIDPRSLLADVFHSVADSACCDVISWHLELPARLPMIKADPVRLRQIMFNLLSNAQRFTDHGHITLGAEVAPPHLHIWVQDTGLGIPMDRQEQIFEPFITAQHPDRQREGIGLGLSIVRQLVALHHGSITLDSRPGEGSAFHVYLPLPSLVDEPCGVGYNGAAASEKRVLLLVSDGEQPPPEVAHLCQRQGLEIRHLQITDTLEKLLAEVQPAALAWDLACASPCHWALIERLRSYSPLCQIPFIIYGPGQRQGGDPHAPIPRTPLRGVGLTSFVIKPVDAKSLLEAIETMRPSATVGPILIVDDDPQTRDYLASLVTQECPGYAVCTAEDGAAALRHMAQEIPSLVILDLRMPGVDGFHVLERMHSNVKTGRVPVLVMTGHPLSLDDIKRLEQYALVTVHSKGILSDDEIASAVHRSLFGTDSLPPQTSALVKRAVVYFHQHYAEPLSRRDVAQAVGVSQNYLSQIFRKELGLSPWDYLIRYRIKQAEQLLRCTTESITAIATRVGFQDPAYFGRVFRAETGISPTAFRAS